MDMHLDTLRENALDSVPFPGSSDTIRGGVYNRIDLDLSQQDGTTEGGPVYIDNVIVLDGGFVAGDIHGTLYVLEGTEVDSAGAPDLSVVPLPSTKLYQHLYSAVVE